MESAKEAKLVWGKYSLDFTNADKNAQSPSAWAELHFQM